MLLMREPTITSARFEDFGAGCQMEQIVNNQESDALITTIYVGVQVSSFSIYDCQKK